MEVSEDPEHQLELYLEQIKSQNETLVQKLQNIDCAHVILEHMLQSTSNNTTSSSSLPHTNRDKLMARACSFAAVLGIGTILLLTILIITRHAPDFVIREKITTFSMLL